MTREKNIKIAKKSLKDSGYTDEEIAAMLAIVEKNNVSRNNRI